MIDTLASRCLDGDTRAVARLISLLEDGDRKAFGTLAALKGRSGMAHVIGITGPPGSGKSTLTDKLIGDFRSRGLRVGVIAVDRDISGAEIQPEDMSKLSMLANQAGLAIDDAQGALRAVDNALAAAVA